MFPRSYGVAHRRRVLVNLIDGTAFEAVLWRRTGELLVLRDAVYLEPGRQPSPLDGEVLVDVARVRFVQVP